MVLGARECRTVELKASIDGFGFWVQGVETLDCSGNDREYSRSSKYTHELEKTSECGMPSERGM